jgi:hypothetical protein
MGAEGSIGGSQTSNKKPDELVLNNNPFQISNVIIAGKLKVRHPLMEEEMIILGFVIEDHYFNQEDFKIKGMSIEYKVKEDYNARNEKIYPKLIIDKMKNHFSIFFGNEEGCRIRHRKPYCFNDMLIKHILNDEHGNIISVNYRTKEGRYTKNEPFFNYYLFDSFTSDIPECAADNVFAVCKYRENDNFKHAIFNFHELIPVENQ